MLRVVVAILLGVSYIVSGLLKLLPVEYMENDMLRMGLGNEVSVLFQSRLIIASEFILGGLISFHLWQKKALKISLWFLAIYSIYLIFLLLLEGSDANCGCYGHDIKMTPMIGLFKNVVIAIISWWLIMTCQPFVKNKFTLSASIATVILGLVLPFVLYKIDLPQTTIIDGKEFKKIFLEPIYSIENNDKPDFDLREGKAIVMFGTLTCSRCIMSLNKLEVIKRQHPELPIYTVLNGEFDLLDEFVLETQMKEVPHTFFNDGDELIKICGNNFPVIYVLNNGYLQAQLSYTELNADNLVRWVNGCY